MELVYPPMGIEIAQFSILLFTKKFIICQQSILRMPDEIISLRPKWWKPIEKENVEW